MDILLPLDHILENLQPPQPSADNKIWVPNDARRLNENKKLSYRWQAAPRA